MESSTVIDCRPPPADPVRCGPDTAENVSFATRCERLSFVPTCTLRSSPRIAGNAARAQGRHRDRKVTTKTQQSLRFHPRSPAALFTASWAMFLRRRETKHLLQLRQEGRPGFG